MKQQKLFFLVLLVAMLATCMTACTTSRIDKNPTNSMGVEESDALNTNTLNPDDIAGPEMLTSNVVCPEFKLADKFILPIEQAIVVPNGYIGITTAEEFSKIELNPTGSYILMNEIDLSSSNFKTISNFMGILDGNGHHLTKADYQALFSSVSEGGRIENLGVYVSGTYEITEYSKIAGITNRLVNGSINNCFLDGEIVFSVTDKTYGTPEIGGLVLSTRSSEISNSYNSCNISSAHGEIGGISFEIHSTQISNCYNEGDLVVAHGSVCGIATRSGWTENSRTEWADAAYSYVQDCYNSGKLQGSGCVSGIFGSDSRIGFTYGTVYRCFNRGSLSGDECFGIGRALQIHDCYNLGNLVGKSIYGIGGSEGSSVNFCYNAGSLNGELIGNIGPDNSNNNSPSIIGDCYYLNNGFGATPGGALFANVKDLSESEMQSKSSFSNFDFVTVWRMGDSDYSFPVFVPLDITET